MKTKLWQEAWCSSVLVDGRKQHIYQVKKKSLYWTVKTHARPSQGSWLLQVYSRCGLFFSSRVDVLRFHWKSELPGAETLLSSFSILFLIKRMSRKSQKSASIWTISPPWFVCTPGLDYNFWQDPRASSRGQTEPRSSQCSSALHFRALLW